VDPVSHVVNLLSWLALGIFPGLLAWMIFVESGATFFDAALLVGRIFVVIAAMASAVVALIRFASFIDRDDKVNE
jgi:hypothetical protein